VETALEPLAALGRLSDPLAWLVVGAFVAVWLVERYDHTERARLVAAGAWVLFGLFWLSLIHHFAFVQKSIVEGLGTVVAVPACLSVAVLLYRGRDSLLVLSRSIAVMGIVFLPFETIGPLRRFLVESVTAQTAFVIHLLGYQPEIVEGMTYDGLQIAAKQHPYWSTFVWDPEGEAGPLTYTVLIACTGVGSMAVIGGLIAAVEAPLARKLRALAVVIPTIYVLNIARNVFIAVGFGTQQFHVFPGVIEALFAVESSVMVSYYVADRLIAQSLSVVVMVAITLYVVRVVPELVPVLEDALYVVTREEYDLQDALGVEPGQTDGEVAVSGD
jgi:archaeosortase A (PGF-CTERM-specific)